MSVNLQYKWAEIIPETGECIKVCTSTINYEDYPDRYVRIDILTDEYLGKYYLNGSWYEDAEGTIPWSPSN